MYGQNEINLYLKKIGCMGNTEVNLHNLKNLHYRHLLHIPYENLDPMNGVPLSLDAKDLFQKIIVNQRGGYCFELQGLFYYLLKSLGYQVTQYAGRFMDEPGHIQMRRHRILVVELDGKRYVCDVGVRSESPRYPLELKENMIQNDGICSYRYERDAFFGWVLMQQAKGKHWKTLLGFTEEPQIDDDYIMPSFYCEQHPDSTFNKFMKISIFTEEANLNIVGNEYRVFQNGRITEKQLLETDAAVRTLLSDRFGIHVPPYYQNLLFPSNEK